MLFTGGPCTSGPGKVVGLDLEETMRSHMDLEKRNPNTVHHRLALTFYEGLGARMVEHGYCLDLFACSLDQVGLWCVRRGDACRRAPFAPCPLPRTPCRARPAPAAR